MKNISRKLFSLTLAGLMTISGGVTAFADVTMAEVVNTGVDLSSPQVLNIVSPNANVKTTSATYYIYGTSNPNYKLYVNDTEITDRGQFGSFGFVVDLAIGNNVITATQNGKTTEVVITRVSNASQLDVYTTTTLTSAFPSFDNYVPSGGEITLSCVAPSGASVVATINGKTVELTQNAATAVVGVPANFSAETTMPTFNASTTNVGSVTYKMTYNGKTTTYYSAGDMFTSSTTSAPIVQNYQSAAPNYYSSSTYSGIDTVLTIGMVDTVVDQTNTMYKLSMGGWVSKSAFQPLEGNFYYNTTIRGNDFKAYDNVEEFIFDTNSFPGFKMERYDGGLKVTLMNTSGLTSLPVTNSSIFSSATVTQANGDTTIDFKVNPNSELWGYTIEYNNGETVLVTKSKPQLSSNPDKPLEGVSIFIDPGHGGYDPGAIGVSGATGANESDLTLATAIAARTVLEDMGAEVTLTRDSDVKLFSNDRTLEALENRADFLISIHYNSITYPSAKGLEVYSYTENSKELAVALQNSLSSNTGAYSRGAKELAFRMALYTACPSVLVEMEFISNPQIYDQVRTDQWLYDSAIGYGEAILAVLK